MKTRAAVIYEAGKPFEVEELDLAGPQDHEVLVEYHYSGLCHSDILVALGDLDARLPMVLGHEGAGVVLEVGPGVTRVKPGDHFIGSMIASCGTCRYCATGRQALCDMGATVLEGCLPSGRFPFTGTAGNYGAMSLLGTFSQYNVIHEHSAIKIDDSVPLDKAALVGCGVPTGWGSAVYAADVRVGQTVVIFGVGGLGVNAVQGAKHAGAKNIVAIDLVEAKLQKAKDLGATHAFTDAAEALEVIHSLTRGQGADSAVLTPGLVTKQIVLDAFNAVGKDGTVVITGLNNQAKPTVELPGTILTLYKKTVRGSIFGDCNPTYDIPRLLDLYMSGNLELDSLITRTYPLEEINQGYEDLENGRNIRGLLVLDH
jgi:alcohol dehydrogenase (nicotinoprotein)